jgi:hypothetical protein
VAHLSTRILERAPLLLLRRLRRQAKPLESSGFSKKLEVDQHTNDPRHHNNRDFLQQ